MSACLGRLQVPGRPMLAFNPGLTLHSLELLEPNTLFVKVFYFYFLKTFGNFIPEDLLRNLRSVPP